MWTGEIQIRVHSSDCLYPLQPLKLEVLFSYFCMLIVINYQFTHNIQDFETQSLQKAPEKFESVVYTAAVSNFRSLYERVVCRVKQCSENGRKLNTADLVYQVM